MVIQGHIMIIQYAIISKNNYKAKKIHGACAIILCFSTLYNEPKCIEIHKNTQDFIFQLCSGLDFFCLIICWQISQGALSLFPSVLTSANYSKHFTVVERTHAPNPYHLNTSTRFCPLRPNLWQDHGVIIMQHCQHTAPCILIWWSCLCQVYGLFFVDAVIALLDGTL